MNYFLDKFRKLLIIISEKIGKLWPDKLYLRVRFLLNGGQYILRFNEPRSFNEKLNWLKLYRRDPQFTKLADKYEVKSYVADVIGEEYVVPNYGVWDSLSDINFNSLPKQFVLKATHDSGGATICKDKDTFDFCSLKKKFGKKALNHNYYWPKREWVYKDIKPRIIADMLLDDGSGHELTDYKFWCFNGEPMYMYCTNKGKKIYENFYDMSFNPVSISHGFNRFQPEFKKPDNFELMKQLASKLSKGFSVIRVDFFDVGGKVYFGEFTFYDWAGLRPFDKIQTDFELGALIKL